MTPRPNALSVAIQGSKGGQGSQHTPTEAPESLHDVARIRILDLLMEGESAGFVHGATNPLRDVYLNETPVCNADDSFNFSDIKVDSRAGTQNQDAMSGFGGTESEVGVGVELRDSVAWSQAFTNLDLSAVRIRIGVDALQKSDASTGDINGYRIEYKIEISTDGAAYVEVGSFAFDGKTSSTYERTHRVDLPAATTGWTVRVTRTTPNSDSATIGDTTRILSYTEIIDALMRYPNSAYVGIIVDAKQFQSPPSRAYDMLGRIMSVPSNYDPVGRTYTGAWDGTFKPAWTNNPAWVFYDLVTNTRFGLGKYVTPARVNKWALYTIAQYCDGLVPDGKGGQEPRFTCTLYLQTQAEAYKVLADLVSVFRGLTYWSGSMVQTIADMPGDPDFEYNPSNVIDGKFEYAGSGRKTRYTVALVSWNDPADFGRAKVEYVPDREGIARYGIQPTQMIAVGATSASQARRAGLWALLTSRLETETVTWGVGQDGVLVAPGRICRIADPNRAGKHQGGRIHSAGTASNLVLHSEDFSNAVWQGSYSGTGSAPTVTPNYAAAPDGTMTACRVQLDLGAATGDQDWSAFQQDADAPDAPETGALWIRSNNGETVKVFLYTLDALVLATVTPEWQRFDALETDPAKQDDGPTATTADLLIWHPQVAADLEPGAYLATQADPVTAMGITVDQAPETAAAGDSLNVMLPSGVSESKTINAIDGRTLVVTGTFSETPVPEAAWTVDAATLATQTVRVLTVREQIEDGKAQYILTGVKHNASKFDAVDYGATAYEPPTVSFPGNSQAAPAAVSLFAYPVQYASSAGMTLTIGWDKPVGAVHYWVQYRRSNGEWTPRRLTSSRHIDVKNVLPGTYEASVVAVNPLGIESNATLSAALAVADPNKVPGIVDDLKAEAGAAKASADQANAQLADIASDNMLTPGEKPIVIRDYNVITTEQAGIDAQATAFGITTEKAAYDGKVTALASYLGTLTSPKAWNDISGNTTIVGATFRQKFADVYTSRQALLNAIYAAAKAQADAAQSTATTAQSLASQVAVLNPGFDAGDTGWTKEGGWTIESDGSFGVGQGYAKHVGSTTNQTKALRNNAICFVQPGKSYTVQALIKAVSANGQCFARISWRDISDTEISTTVGNAITGTTVNGSYATGQAPNGAVYAHAEIATSAHTSGTYMVDNVVSTLQPATADEIAEGTSRKWAVESGADVTGARYGLGPNVCPNPKFLSNSVGVLPDTGLTSGNVCDGWAIAARSACFTVLYEGGQNLLLRVPSGTVVGTGTSACRIYSALFPVAPGDKIEVFGVRKWDSNAGLPAGVSGLARLGVIFADATGASLAGEYGTSDRSGPGYDTPTTPYLVTVPSGAAYARVQLCAFIINNSGAAFTTSGLVMDVRFDDVEVRHNDVRSAGSGARLGDLRNQVMVGVGNFASGWSGGAITVSSTTTSATITASAASLQIGSASLAYNQASTTVSGSAGVTQTYYLYYDDDSYLGGSRTLHATTSQITALAADGRVFVGSVTFTFPTSGVGGGTGLPGCPDENAWVLRADPDDVHPDWPVRARDVEVGHFLRLTDGRAGLVTYSERKAADRVRVFDENGESLTCSRSAPLELAGTSGECVLAPEASGRQIKARAEGAAFDPLVWKVEDAGPGYVQHITCQNACFWTGDDPDYLFGHHNMKPAQ